MKVVTNNQPRELLHWHDLTKAEQAEAESLLDEQAEESTYFRYKGQVYSLSEFMRLGGQPKEWDGVHNETFWSGVLVRVVEHGEAVVVGSYYE